MADTNGISEIGSSYASFGPVPLDDVRMIDWDSFFEGVRGIDGVFDMSTKTSASLTLAFFAMSCWRLRRVDVAHSWFHENFFIDTL